MDRRELRGLNESANGNRGTLTGVPSGAIFRRMPQHIHALFANVPAQREQVQRMLLDAGMIDSAVEAPPDGLLYRIELPDEETAQRLLLAAKLHGVDTPIIRR